MSVKLEDTVYFHFGTSDPTTGAATDADSLPTATVEEDGVAMGYSPTVTNVTTGLYRVTIAATTGNGFEAGKRYSVYVVAAVSTITGRDGIAEFVVEANYVDDLPASVWNVPVLGKTALLLLLELNAAQVIRLGEFQAGSTAQAVVIDTGASALDDFYNRTTMTIVTGASAGQNRLINDYNGTTKVAYLDRPLLVGAPGSGDYFCIDSRGNTRSASDLSIGLAQSGAVGSITLEATADGNNDFYNRMIILIESGTGVGQARLISAYNGTSKVATVAREWVTTPDATSRYVIIPMGSVKVSEMDDDTITAAAIAAGAITATEAPALANLDAAVSSRGTADPGDAMTLTAAYDAAKTAAQAGDAMDLVNSAITSAKFAADAISAAALAAAAAQKIRDEILDDATRFSGADVDAAISSRAVPGDAMDLITDAVDAAALAADALDEIWDEIMEGAYTARHYMKLMAAVLTGKSSGGGTTTHVYRDTGDTKNRISATLDSDGNRTAVGTRDGT